MSRPKLAPDTEAMIGILKSEYYRNINGYCPHCGVSFDGKLVFEVYADLGYDFETALKYARLTDGFDDHTLHNRYDESLAVVDNKENSIKACLCKECNTTFIERIYQR